MRRRLVDYFAHMKESALADVFRLLGVLAIAFASIVCIALDKERIYFTNILTFVVGVIVDSPLRERGGGGGGGGVAIGESGAVRVRDENNS